MKAARLRACMDACIPLLAQGCPSRVPRTRSGGAGSVSGSVKPHTADLESLCAVFYIIHVNSFILFHRVADSWRQKAWAV